MESIVVAVITAGTSIIVAIIQTRREDAGKPNAGTERAREGASQSAWRSARDEGEAIWLWVGGLMLVANGAVLAALPEVGPYIVHLGSVPWASSILAWTRPIKFGYAAAFVTLVSLAAVGTYYVVGGGYIASDVPILALVFSANAVLAGGLAFWSGKRRGS